MALSDDEERILAEMAKSLYEQDPKLARSMNSVHGGNVYVAAVGVLSLLAGMGLIIASVALNMVLIGAVGFCIALFGATKSYKNFSSEGASIPSDRPKSNGASSKPRGGSSIMDTMNKRWERRQQEGS